MLIYLCGNIQAYQYTDSNRNTSTDVQISMPTLGSYTATDANTNTSTYPTIPKIYYTMLCYAMLCYAMLCYAMLYYNEYTVYCPGTGS